MRFPTDLDAAQRLYDDLNDNDIGPGDPRRGAMMAQLRRLERHITKLKSARPLNPVEAFDAAERESMTLPQRWVITSLRENGDTTRKALAARLQKQFVYLSGATVELALDQLVARKMVTKVGAHFRAAR